MSNEIEIGKNINNIFAEGELIKELVVANFATTTKNSAKTEIYHLGASLKDLGKKWFAFSKLDKSSVDNILKAITK